MAIERSLKPLYAKRDVQLELCRFVCYVHCVRGDSCVATVQRIFILLSYCSRCCITPHETSRWPEMFSPHSLNFNFAQISPSKEKKKERKKERKKDKGRQKQSENERMEGRTKERRKDGKKNTRNNENKKREFEIVLPFWEVFQFPNNGT